MYGELSDSSSPSIFTLTSNKQQTQKACHCQTKRALSRFEHFCELTTIHGWKQLASEPGLAAKVTWSLIVAFTIVIFGVFAYLNVTEFVRSTTVTAISSMTAPLDAVRFPALTVCNVNPVSAAFLRSIGVRDLREMRAFIRSYVRGDDDEWEKHLRDNTVDPFFDEAKILLKTAR